VPDRKEKLKPFDWEWKKVSWTTKKRNVHNRSYPTDNANDDLCGKLEFRPGINSEEQKPYSPQHFSHLRIHFLRHDGSLLIWKRSACAFDLQKPQKMMGVDAFVVIDTLISESYELVYFVRLMWCRLPNHVIQISLQINWPTECFKSLDLGWTLRCYDLRAQSRIWSVWTLREKLKANMDSARQSSFPWAGICQFDRSESNTDCHHHALSVIRRTLWEQSN
jgi:hypothetical protein